MPRYRIRLSRLSAVGILIVSLLFAVPHCVSADESKSNIHLSGGLSKNLNSADRAQISINKNGKSSQTTRSAVDSTNEPNAYLKEPAYRRKRAIIIGINNYPQPIPSLNFAVNDATAVADLLNEEYGFSGKDIFLLLDKKSLRERNRKYAARGFNLLQATRANILRLLGTQGGSNSSATSGQDAVFFYYAGHGDRTRGDLLPADYRANVASSAVPLEELLTRAENLPAKNLFMAFDSCYSGHALEQLLVQRKAGQKRTAQSSIQILSAGSAKESVVDGFGDMRHSLFTNYFLNVLKSESLRTDRRWRASDIISLVHTKVSSDPISRQNPRGGYLRGDDEFEFEPSSGVAQIPWTLTDALTLEGDPELHVTAAQAMCRWVDRQPIYRRYALAERAAELIGQRAERELKISKDKGASQLEWNGPLLLFKENWIRRRAERETKARNDKEKPQSELNSSQMLLRILAAWNTPTAVKSLARCCRYDAGAREISILSRHFEGAKAAAQMALTERDIPLSWPSLLNLEDGQVFFDPIVQKSVASRYSLFLYSTDQSIRESTALWFLRRGDSRGIDVYLSQCESESGIARKWAMNELSSMVLCLDDYTNVPGEVRIQIENRMLKLFSSSYRDVRIEAMRTLAFTGSKQATDSWLNLIFQGPPSDELNRHEELESLEKMASSDTIFLNDFDTKEIRVPVYLQQKILERASILRNSDDRFLRIEGLRIQAFNNSAAALVAWIAESRVVKREEEDKLQKLLGSDGVDTAKPENQQGSISGIETGDTSLGLDEQEAPLPVNIESLAPLDQLIALAPFFKDEDEHVYATNCAFFARSPVPEAVDFLVRECSNPDVGRRIFPAYLLAEKGDPRALPVLLEFVEPTVSEGMSDQEFLQTMARLSAMVPKAGADQTAVAKFRQILMEQMKYWAVRDSQGFTKLSILAQETKSTEVLPEIISYLKSPYILREFEEAKKEHDWYKIKNLKRGYTLTTRIMARMAVDTKANIFPLIFAEGGIPTELAVIWNREIYDAGIGDSPHDTGNEYPGDIGDIYSISYMPIEKQPIYLHRDLGDEWVKNIILGQVVISSTKSGFHDEALALVRKHGVSSYYAVPPQTERYFLPMLLLRAGETRNAINMLQRWPLRRTLSSDEADKKRSFYSNKESIRDDNVWDYHSETNYVTAMLVAALVIQDNGDFTRAKTSLANISDSTMRVEALFRASEICSSLGKTELNQKLMSWGDDEVGRLREPDIFKRKPELYLMWQLAKAAILRLKGDSRQADNVLWIMWHLGNDDLVRFSFEQEGLGSSPSYEETLNSARWNRTLLFGFSEEKQMRLAQLLEWNGDFEAAYALYQNIEHIRSKQHKTLSAEMKSHIEQMQKYDAQFRIELDADYAWRY